MLEKLAIRRDRHRESIRKQHHTQILQKMRLQLLSRLEISNGPYLDMNQRIKDQENQPFCAQFATEVLQFACQYNNDKSMIILGNYLIDHVPQSLFQAYTHLIGFWSDSRFFSWIIRMLLECNNDPRPYIQTIDRMVHSCQQTEAVFIVYALKCVQFLVENNHISLLLNELTSLPYLVKSLTKVEHKEANRLANSIVLDMLTHSEPARQRLLSKMGVQSELTEILKNGSLGLFSRCITAIKAIVQKSLETVKSIELLTQLQVLYHCCEFSHQQTIGKILLAVAQESSTNLFVVINAGLRNILGLKLDVGSFPPDIIFGQLRLIDTIFRQLSKLSESEALVRLKENLQQKNNLSDRLLELLEHQDGRISGLAEEILNNNYDFVDDESLIPQ